MSNKEMKLQLLTYSACTKNQLEAMTDTEVLSAWLRLAPNIILKTGKIKSLLERARIIEMINLQKQIDSTRKGLEDDKLNNRIDEENIEVKESLLRALENDLKKLANMDEENV